MDEQRLQSEINERKRAESALRDSEALYHSLVETIPLSVWRKDVDGRFTFVNTALCKALNQSADELLGKTDADFSPPELARKYQRDDQEVMETGRAKEDVEEHRHTDGSRAFIHVIKAPIYDFAGNLLGTQGLFWDITARRMAEMRLAQTAAELERSNQELEQFASVASHDLQEPLRKVQAFGDRLKTKCGDQLSEDGRDYLERMQNAARRMGVLINDLLTFSRVTSRAQPYNAVDLNQVAQEVLSDLEVRIEQSRALVEMAELPTLEADPTQMRQLFQNLIGNALKFQREGVPPRVEIRAAKRDGLCEITVADNGIGFEPKFADRIFGIFQRLHGRDEYEGTGIGLAICQKIAVRHGGNIVARGRPGEGATFVVTMLLRHERDAKDHERNETDHDRSGR